jgi:tRNA-specific 2-thiouridylase
LNFVSKKAVALVSSGLDSILAAFIVKRLNIEVVGLHCVFRFDPNLESDNRPPIKNRFLPAGIPVIVRDVTAEFLPVVLKPDHGYGSQVNPCIDCKIFMFKRAKELMQEAEADFLVTGEVLGQRPMTQTRSMMIHIEKESGLRGLVLRPLCALHMEMTVPEQQGWIDREQLFAFAGRGRKDQIALAKTLGIKEYEQPAGGCILTNPQFAARARALLKFRKVEEIQIADFQLLHLGRHFWPNPSLHCIVGRNEQDNAILERFCEGRAAIEPKHIPGPLALAETREQDDIELCSRIVARYCKHRGQPVLMECRLGDRIFEIEANPLKESETAVWRV